MLRSKGVTWSILLPSLERLSVRVLCCPSLYGSLTQSPSSIMGLPRPCVQTGGSRASLTANLGDENFSRTAPGCVDPDFHCNFTGKQNTTANCLLIDIVAVSSGQVPGKHRWAVQVFKRTVHTLDNFYQTCDDIVKKRLTARKCVCCI